MNKSSRNIVSCCVSLHSFSFLVRTLVAWALRVLAAEQSKIGGLKVLNYAPGPMNTDMARDIRSDEQYEDDLRSGKLIDPQVSAAKCVGLALGAGYKSGAHIDFFDEVDNS